MQLLHCLQPALCRERPTEGVRFGWRSHLSNQSKNPVEPLGTAILHPQQLKSPAFECICLQWVSSLGSLHGVSRAGGGRAVQNALCW